MKNVQIEKHYLISCGDIYSCDDIEPSIILKDIPKGQSVEFISYLLHLFNIRKKDDHLFQLNHLRRWANQMDNDDKEKVETFILRESELVHSKSFKLIDRRPSLNLIQHLIVYSQNSDGNALNKAQYTVLFKCLLHFNTTENEVQKELFNWNDNGDIEEFANHILTVQVRNIDHVRYKNYAIQFLKVVYFFQFCQVHEKYSAHLSFFIASLGLGSYSEYLWKLIDLYLKVITSELDTPKFQIHDLVENEHFFDRLSINDNEITIDKDYKPIRTFPLYKSGNGTYVFMDYRFFVDKLYQSFLFDFSAINGIGYGKLKSDMGNEFSEHVLFYITMNKCFHNYGSVRLTGKEIKKHIESGEPDYYIRKGSNLFLFEFKDIGITTDIKYAENPEKIKKGISEKLEVNSKGRKKGISQLLNTIGEIVSGLYLKKSVDDVQVDQAVFYPIIVHTDITLESCGVNYFLNRRMNELVMELGLSNITIKGLVMINIDTLIQLQDHFSDGKLELEECLKSYLDYINCTQGQTATYPFDEFIKYHFVETNNERIGQPRDFADVISSLAKSSELHGKLYT